MSTAELIALGFIAANLLILVFFIRIGIRRARWQRRHTDEDATRLDLYPEPQHFDSLHRPRVGIDRRAR